MRIFGLVGLLLVPLHAIICVRAAERGTAALAPSYRDLVGTALSSWTRVFAARFWASTLVALGTVAFVVPGVLLAVRYAFVEVLAIVERMPGAPARRRSAELARGRTRPILRLLVSVAATMVGLAVLVGAAIGFHPEIEIDNFVTAALGDVLFDVALSCLYGGAWFIYRDATDEPLVHRPDPIF